MARGRPAGSINRSTAVQVIDREMKHLQEEKQQILAGGSIPQDVIKMAHQPNIERAQQRSQNQANQGNRGNRGNRSRQGSDSGMR